MPNTVVDMQGARSARSETDGATGDELGYQAYARIKEDIVRCLLPPGADLTEGRLTDRYGFGKGPIRSALLRLRHDGLVQSERRKGYKVTVVTFDDVQDVFHLRLVLEPEAARLAAGRLSEDDVRALRAACEVSLRPDDPDSDAIFLRSNKAFHVGIAEASGNAKLAYLISNLLDDAERILHLGLAKEPRSLDFQSEHKELLHLLMTNQADRAAETVRRQIEGGLSMVMRSLLSGDSAGATTIRAP